MALKHHNIEYDNYRVYLPTKTVGLLYQRLPWACDPMSSYGIASILVNYSWGKCEPIGPI